MLQLRMPTTGSPHRSASTNDRPYVSLCAADTYASASRSTHDTCPCGTWPRCTILNPPGVPADLPPSSPRGPPAAPASSPRRSPRAILATCAAMSASSSPDPAKYSTACAARPPALARSNARSSSSTLLSYDSRPTYRKASAPGGRWRISRTPGTASHSWAGTDVQKSAGTPRDRTTRAGGRGSHLPPCST
eukprot:scaffold12470_cov119-Isochrysis_galbana.AAC.6